MSTSIVAQPDKSLCAVPAGRPGEYLAPRPAVPLRGSGHLPPAGYSAAADAPAGTSLPGVSGRGIAGGPVCRLYGRGGGLRSGGPAPEQVPLAALAADGICAGIT